MANIDWTSEDPMGAGASWDETAFPVLTTPVLQFPTADKNRGCRALYQIQRIPNTRDLAIKYRLQFRTYTSVNQKYYGKARLKIGDADAENGPTYDSGSTTYHNQTWENSTRYTAYAKITGIKNREVIKGFISTTSSEISADRDNIIPNPIKGPALFIEINPSMIEADSVSININNAWIEADSAYVYASGDWREA